MSRSESQVTYASGLRAGDWVEVRSLEEILATLDEQGRLDALPFMPEMTRYCGKRFRVFKSAHKACDTLSTYKNRHMADAVHLEGLRCDGDAHGGCQAGCLLFWKEQWLKRSSAPGAPENVRPEIRAGGSGAPGLCTLEGLNRAARTPSADGEDRYRCQATDMLEATTPIPWWDVRPYVKDLSSGNVRLFAFLRFGAARALLSAFQYVIRLNWRGRRSPQYPVIRGLADKTPVEVLNLQAGDRVRVRSKAEIMQTINAAQRNRGLWYDEEMLPFCDQEYTVLRKVERIIDERSGKMLAIKGNCIILDGVVCGGNRSKDRLFCPRSIYPYWREIWLKRVDSTDQPDQK